MKKILSNRVNFVISLSILLLVIIGVVCGLVGISIKSQLLGMIAAGCLTLSVLPLLLTQVAFTVGVEGFILNPTEYFKRFKRALYIILFPFINLYFLVGLNILFKFYPMCKSWIRNDYLQESVICLLALYTTLVVAGLIWRYLRYTKIKKTLIA